jgi:hypothetical protein
MKKIIYISTALLVLIACGQAETNAAIKAESGEAIAESVIKPLNFDLGATTYKVDALKGDTIFLDNGGTVVFDTDCFVDSEGNLVKGEVDVAWQEFHSLADIMASGIPMKFDSAGVDNDLISGGMFTIQASQKGQQIEMAKGKGAEVNMVSLQDTPCYNFYDLDEETGDWNYQTTKNGEVVEEIEPTVDKVDGAIIEAQLSLKDYPELQDKDLIGWKTTTELSKKTTSWLKQPTTKIRILKNAGNFYVLEAKAGKALKTFKANPYTIEQAIIDSRANQSEHDQAINEIEEYQNKMAAGKVVRSIRVEGFGTYNWDICGKRENSRGILASFDFPTGVNKKLVTMSLISPEENAVINYNPEGDHNFSFDPGKKCCLVAILPSNELVIVDNNGFNKARELSNGSPHTFTFKKTGIKLESPEELSHYIDKLI